MPTSRTPAGRFDSLLSTMLLGSPGGLPRRSPSGMQGNVEGQVYGMGAVEPEARRRAWAADGGDVASGPMKFLFMQT